jgi:hypothetical protein
MSRGVHFALSADRANALLKATSDRGRIKILEEIEEAWEEPFVCETDKAWEWIHRSLTDGELLYDNGTYPLNHCICGGKQLYRGDDYTISFVSAQRVAEVAAALQLVTKPWMREKYDAIDPEHYEFALDDEDFEYLWENLVDIREFYARAAKAERAVIFTADC